MPLKHIESGRASPILSTTRGEKGGALTLQICHWHSIRSSQKVASACQVGTLIFEAMTIR